MAKVRTETIGKWVRARLGGELIVETRSPTLVWQGGFPPVYGFAGDAVRADVLQPASRQDYPGGFFFGPHLPVRTWWDVVAGGSRHPAAAWALDDPALRDLVFLTWEPGLIDWTEEDEPVAGHPRDPHKRVEALPSSRHVEVSVDGVVLARSDRPVLLFETDLPTRYYLPPEDVALDLLDPTPNTSLCPYKGIADSYWTYPGPAPLRNVAWSYSRPFGAVANIAGRIAFYNELVDLTVDGERLERPRSPFSDSKQRPGADA